jgi:hypothetical protein
VRWNLASPRMIWPALAAVAAVGGCGSRSELLGTIASAGDGPTDGDGGALPAFLIGADISYVQQQEETGSSSPTATGHPGTSCRSSRATGSTSRACVPSRRKRGLGAFVWEPTEWQETLFDAQGRSSAADLPNPFIVGSPRIALFDQMASDYGLR